MEKIIELQRNDAEKAELPESFASAKKKVDAGAACPGLLTAARRIRADGLPLHRAVFGPTDGRHTELITRTTSVARAGAGFTVSFRPASTTVKRGSCWCFS